MPLSISVKSNLRPPLRVLIRAAEEVKVFSCGQKNYARIRPRSHLVIRLGRNWRLLSKNNGNSWVLMTHETYNHEARI